MLLACCKSTSVEGGAREAAATQYRSVEFDNIGQGNKKALLIGINYFGQPGQLKGCINDVANVKKLIMRRGFQDSADNMKVLHEGTTSVNPATEPTRENIIEGKFSCPLP